MTEYLPSALVALSRRLSSPLYLVGGSVRDFLMGRLSPPIDFDLSSPAGEEEVLAAAKACGFSAVAVYSRTGTVKLALGGLSFEFTRFRSDGYVRGNHAPATVTFTGDIAVDARRRDFCANAVYFDIAAERFCDPLGGREDIARGVLRTVRDPALVFGEDGLRLMRLARISAETGLLPDPACLAGAAKNAALIRDIAPERIFEELRRILFADAKGGDPYRGLSLLRSTGVLREILPELAAGDGMPQPPAFHKYDVLEHTFRTVQYSDPAVRFAALFHDVGKPFTMDRDGNFHAHAEEGARLTEEILTRFKAKKTLIRDTAFLVKMHMLDLDCKMREVRVRRALAECGPLLNDLLLLKQADYSACKDDLSEAPCVAKWKGILQRMKEQNVPLSLRELRIGGEDLLALGAPERTISDILSELFRDCLCGAPNQKDALLARAKKSIERRTP